MIEILGVTVHDPDVVFTDLGLAALSAVLGWRLWRAADRGTLATAGAVLMAALASAALWGAVFHAFFPAGTATRPGYLLWLGVALSIVVAGATLVDLVIRLAAPGIPASGRLGVVGLYAGAYAAVVVLVDESFTTIVRFYVPALLLFLLAAGREALRGRPGWTLITAGVVVSVGAGAIQQARIALHPVHFDHNALYHVIQGGAALLLYLGFQRGRLRPSTAHADRADPARRGE